MSKYITVVETAKLVRAALKENFPNTKFSVKSNSYSGGASIDVRWTDGETTKEVDDITSRYSGASFDGMIDLKSYHDAVLDGEQVHFGADYVFSHRDTSISFRMKTMQAICAYFKYDALVMNRWNWFERTDIFPMHGRDELTELINQVMYATNADNMTLHPGNGYVQEWMSDVWARFLHPEIAPLIDAAPVTMIEEQAKTAFAEFQRGIAEAEAAEEAEDTTPCVKVHAETLQPIKAVMEEGVRCLRPDTLRERLASIDANALSPLEALTLIYELKRLL